MLPLIAPGISQSLAAELLDRAASSGSYGSGVWQHARGAGDVLAWGLVVCFLLTLGVIAGCILSLRSRPRQPTPEQLLIEEVQRDEDRLAGTAPGPEHDSQPWERPGDWWKSEG